MCVTFTSPLTITPENLEDLPLWSLLTPEMPVMLLMRSMVLRWTVVPSPSCMPRRTARSLIKCVAKTPLPTATIEAVAVAETDSETIHVTEGTVEEETETATAGGETATRIEMADEEVGAAAAVIEDTAAATETEAGLVLTPVITGTRKFCKGPPDGEELSKACCYSCTHKSISSVEVRKSVEVMHVIKRYVKIEFKDVTRRSMSLVGK